MVGEVFCEFVDSTAGRSMVGQGRCIHIQIGSIPVKTNICPLQDGRGLVIINLPPGDWLVPPVNGTILGDQRWSLLLR